MQYYNLSKYETTTSVRKGRVITKVLGDELDSSTIVLTQVGKMDVEPYDLIELSENSHKECWLISDYTKTFIKKDSPQLYDYQLDLMSVTKLLETVLLPNMTITNIGQNRSFKFYIEKVFNQYIKERLKGYIDTTFIDEVNVVVDLPTAFNDVCPECTFSQPTLREYLDYLMEFKGYIAQLSAKTYTYLSDDDTEIYVLEWKLGAFNLNPSGIGSLPIDCCDNIYETQTSQDYVTELQTEAESIIGGSVTEFQMLKADDIIYSSTVAKVITDNPIYDLESVKLVNSRVYKFSNQESEYVGDTTFRHCTMGVFRYDSTKNMYIRWTHPDYFELNQNHMKEKSVEYGSNTTTINIPFVELMNKIVEENIYSSLTTLDVDTYFNSFKFTNGEAKYTNDTMSFTRGSNTINNLFSYQSRVKGLFNKSDNPAIYYAIYSRMFDELPNNFTKLDNNVKICLDESSSPDTTKYTLANGDYYLFPYDFEIDGYIYTFYLLMYKPLLKYSFYVTRPSQQKGFYKSAKFMVKYKPYTNVKVSQVQDGYNHLISTPNNTTNALTDIKTFYAQAKERNKQLGNNTIIFNGYSTDSNKFKLGQTYVVDNDTYVLNKLEIQNKLNINLFKGTLTKNYSSRNIQTILNREKRYYSLADSSESVNRNEVYSVTFDNGLDKLLYNHEQKSLVHPTTYVTGEIGDENIVIAGIYVDNVFKGSVPCKWSLLEANEDNKATAYTLTVAMVDNVTLGYIRDANATIESIPTSMQVFLGDYYEKKKAIFYADDVTGEASNVKIVFDVVRLYDIQRIGNQWVKVYEDFSEDEYYEYSKEPYPSSDYVGYTLNLGSDYLKDNREKMTITLNVRINYD